MRRFLFIALALGFVAAAIVYRHFTKKQTELAVANDASLGHSTAEKARTDAILDRSKLITAKIGKTTTIHVQPTPQMRKILAQHRSPEGDSGSD